MLTALDETFMHQAALPFELCAVSDHRFFDRTVATAAAPDGSSALILGMGVYKNMNVLDGFAAVQIGHARQHNLRLSRELRPDLNAVLGPLRVEIVKPFEQIRYVLDANEAPFRFDVSFHKFLDAVLEEPHNNRTQGRITQDYLRFNQLMRAEGTLSIEGQEIAVENWFAWRDHSWGVRPGVGGFEPPIPGVSDKFPSAARAGGKGMMLFYLGFNAGDEIGGGLQIIENGEGGYIYHTGHIGAPDRQSPIKSYEWSVKTFPGTRAPRHLQLHVTTEAGDTHVITAEPTTRPWAYRAFGYDGGYNDKKGQGVWRAKELLTEFDTWDISHPEDVFLPDGAKVPLNHRETAVRVTVDGRAGYGYMPFIAIGDVQKLRET